MPAIAGALALLEDADAVAGGSRRNREWAEPFATFDADVPEAQRRLVCDAMTSGGLLVALPAERAEALEAPVVGRLVDGVPGAIQVRP